MILMFPLLSTATAVGVYRQLPFLFLVLPEKSSQNEKLQRAREEKTIQIVVSLFLLMLLVQLFNINHEMRYNQRSCHQISLFGENV